jgi:hypothetical protein
MEFKSLIIEDKEFNYNLLDGKLYSYKKKLNKYTKLSIYKNTDNIPRIYLNKKRVYLQRIIYKIFNKDWDLFDKFNYVNLKNGIKNADNCNIDNLELLANENCFNEDEKIKPSCKITKPLPVVSKVRRKLINIIGYNKSKIEVKNRVILNF